MNDQICSYTQQGFIMPIIGQETQGYASVNAEMYGECGGGLDNTGNYCVYLLHPEKGSFNFKVEFDAEHDELITDQLTEELAPGVINEILNRIKSHRKGEFSKLTHEFYINREIEVFELEQ